MRLLSELAESFEAHDQGRRSCRTGPLIAVTGGRGGGGASVFAAALAQCAGEALLVDLDGCGGGIDLLMGGESAPGLRWPDLSVRAGRLNWTAVRDALPRCNGVTVLSATRVYCDIDAGAAAAVVGEGAHANGISRKIKHVQMNAICFLEAGDLALGGGRFFEPRMDANGQEVFFGGRREEERLILKIRKLGVSLRPSR